MSAAYTGHWRRREMGRSVETREVYRFNNWGENKERLGNELGGDQKRREGGWKEAGPY